ncbi:cystatin-F-like isoform X1 [Thamnophis elegans]|uniref:cystatin-F-like isoform X1 n=1 Tax=Thamnophis elegans TaxID=35005 RepID=UPI0013774221|nr:cystatin-F-like isoform X1 [Thamnophis elegans]XP_032068562.1 cystatin-F-like isoform X1 [Thamnophis elegans]XP_032068563.1 cystatin-F-like isoform X1 [Thamnophis elegans]
MFFGWRIIILCFLLLYGVPKSSTGASGQFPNSLIQPGSPFPVKTNDPNVQRAARLGVYKYNNSTNDIFLFKESHINKATVQIVKGVKYRLDVDICRTVCRKRIPHPNLDRCDFQKNKMLQKVYVQLLCTVLRNRGWVGIPDLDSENLDNH